MPIKKQVVQEKLVKIRNMMDRIENMDFTEEEFGEDLDIQDLLVFRLEQATEAAIDIATHIISAEKLPRPENLKGLFEVLGEGKILTGETAEAMVKAVGFRNIAVHEYDDVKFDIKRVYGDYKDDVRDLKRFCEEVVEILEKEN